MRGSPEAFLHDTTNTYDVVDTEDLSERLTIRGVAYDPSSSHLWLHGGTSNETYYFYEVDAIAEPDVLVRRIWFPRPVRALTFHGPDMWAIMDVLTSVIVRIDPQSGKVVATYEMPDEVTLWLGLTFGDDGSLYVLGRDENGNGVIVQSPQGTASI